MTVTRVRVVNALVVVVTLLGAWWVLVVLASIVSVPWARNDGPMREVTTHGFSDTVEPGVPFTDAAEILKIDGGSDATLLAVESPTDGNGLDQIGFMVAGEGRHFSNYVGVLEGWPVRQPWMPTPVPGAGASIAPYDAPTPGSPGSLLLVGYELRPGVDIAVRPELVVRYEVDGQTYESTRIARMVVCDAQTYTERRCGREADRLFPEG